MDLSNLKHEVELEDFLKIYVDVVMMFVFKTIEHPGGKMSEVKKYPVYNRLVVELILWELNHGKIENEEGWIKFAESIEDREIVKSRKSLVTHRSNMAKLGVIDSVRRGGVSASRMWFKALDSGKFSLELFLNDGIKEDEVGSK